jgi:excisionase family DNA binding protein
MDQTLDEYKDQDQALELMTVPQAAEKMKIAESFLYKLIQEKEIPYFRIGRKYILRREDIDLFLAKHYQVPKGWSST